MRGPHGAEYRFHGHGRAVSQRRGAFTKSVAALLAPELFHYSPARILHFDGRHSGRDDPLRRRFPDVNLALSLHSVRQEVREQLIPLAAKYSLDELHAAVAQINAIQNNTVMIEYLMLAGINDSADDARELVAWLAGLDVHVNLIPYNPIASAPYLRTTERPERDAFAAILKAAGITTTIRYSLGADIAAACGQLVQTRKSAIARLQATTHN